MRSSVSVPLVPSTFPQHAYILYATSSGAGGRQGCAFDAAVGAALLSVVDLPDLSTVNIQG